MKSIKKICLVFFLTILLLIGTSFAETGKVNVSAIRLRKENNTSSEILTNIYENDTVEILGEVEDWYQIKYNGKTGYVKKEYITVDKKTENIANTNTTNTANTSNVSSTNTANATQNSNTVENTSNQVNSNEVSNLDGTVLTFSSVANLKISPSLISTNISQFNQSKQVKKLAEMGNWLQVTDGTLTGWVLKSKTMDSNANQVNTSDLTNNTSENTVTNTEVQNVTNNITNSTNTTNSTKNTNTVNNTNTVSDENRTTSSLAEKTGKINVETANVRKEANKKSSIIEFLDYNDVVNIISEEGDWYKITAKNNISGYVSKTLVTLSTDNTVTSRSLSEERNNVKDDTVVNKEINDSLTNALVSANSGNEVAEYAKQFLGYSYVVGGKTPSSGFDCSGFTRYIYSNFGYSLGSTAASQDSVGTEVSRDDLQVGDLILFYNEGKTAIGHTGIYIGNSEFIHSANPNRGVVTDNFNTNSYYNERFVSARRIVE